MTGIEGDLGWSRSLLSSGATLALVAMAAGNLFGGTLWTVTGVALSVGIRREPAPQAV